MKIIQLKNVANGFASIDFSRIDMNAVMREGNLEIITGKQFTWNRNTGNQISDCPFYIGSMPIFETEKLRPALNSLNVKSAEFKVEGKQYTMIAAPQISGSVINREASEMRAFRNGEIMTVQKYVFNANYEYPEIFTPKEFIMDTFCSLNAAKNLLYCQFHELKFIECEII
jgi:hypothetical protein